MAAITYPSVRRDESAVEDHYGQQVADPYRWLEDPDSEETGQFVKDQNAVTMPYLEGCEARNKFHARMTELYNYPKYSVPFKRGSRYYFFMNTGLQNQSVLYVQESLNGDPEVFLDPNQLSSEGTVSLGGYSFSENGEYFAYGLSESGSDWNTIQVKEVATKEDLGDSLKRVKFSGIAWTHDHKGFFYQRYPENDSKADGTETSQVLNQKTHYHVVGSPQSDDVLCYEFPDHPDWLSSCELSDEGRYVIMYVSQGAEPKNKLFYCDLDTIDHKIEGILPMVKLIDDDFEASYDFIANDGAVFVVQTDHNAANYCLMKIDVNKPDKSNWQMLVPPHDKDVLQWSACVNNTNLVMCYLRDVKSVLVLHELESGKFLTNFPLDLGSVTGYSGKRRQTEMFFRFVSFLTPGLIYHVDLSQTDIKPKVFRQIEVKGFDRTLFETEQVFYTSKDGTTIPMFIIHKKGMTLDGTHPTLLYGYGGFSVSITPSFSASRVIFMQHLGGIMAIANIRGGGEYGDRWHKDGIFEKRQNVFDDFIAGAEYLIENKYTSAKRLAIQGGSNGGLLVCACTNQRPDLFQCVISQVGVLDLLRFHKFTIGHAWVTDFGNPDKEPDFRWIYKISALHNIKLPEGDQQYPAMLLLTADHDDRVVPLHSFKFIAELHHIMRGVDKQTNPLMIRIEEKAGHGGGKPTTKVIDEIADVYGFIARTLGVNWTD